MSAVSRRHFLTLSGSTAAVGPVGPPRNPCRRGDGAHRQVDLVIKGGDVLDPSQSLRGKRDIGIRWGVVEAIESEIPAARRVEDD